jgi:hypothetical protein
MTVLRKVHRHRNNFVCAVNYDLPMEELIAKERMGKFQKRSVLAVLDEHKDRLGQKGKRKVVVRLFKPDTEMSLNTVFNKISKYGRPATLREAITLCRSNPNNHIKKKITVIGRHGRNQPLVSLAYWFDRAWHLTSFISTRIWRPRYPYEFAYVLN